SAAIPYTDVLTITSDDPDYPVKTVALQGQGLPVTAGVLSVPGAVIEFPATAMGDTSIVTVPLFNAGTQDLVVDSVIFSNGVFSATANNLLVSVGTTHNLPVSFIPDTVSGYICGLYIHTNTKLDPAVVLLGTGFEGFFNVVEPTGNPYTVVVDSLVGPLDSAQTGDEIGIFDGSTSVGVAIVNKSSFLSGNQYSLNYTATPGNPGVQFDNLSSVLQITDEVTVELWVKINGYPSWNSIIASSMYSLMIGSDGNVTFHWDEDGGGWQTITSTDPVPLNTWTHLSAVRDENNYIKVYLNGTLSATGWGSTPINSSSLSLFGGDFSGSFDEFRIWNRSLTQTEIQANMNIELYGIGTGLVGYWNFNEGESTTVTDLTGNGNDGTISVATWSTEVPFNLQSESMKISGTTWQADTDKGQVGFTPGNPMTFRYFARRNGAAAVYEASHIALQGDGNFGTEPYAVVQVNSSTESIHPDRVSTLADLTVVEDSGPNNFSIAFNNYFIHPFDPLG
ncbi:uncharacterized protein METZ01_LOCUS222542, partial [marine metagenome]